MTVIVTVSDGGGMLFNNRRQSKDRLLLDDLSRLVGDGALYISDFSERLFEKSDLCTIAVTNPLESAAAEDFAFIESLGIKEYKDKIERLVIYRWNRAYPYDFGLDFSPEKEGMRLLESYDFKGSSHEKITREIWVKGE